VQLYVCSFYFGNPDFENSGDQIPVSDWVRPSKSC